LHCHIDVAQKEDEEEKGKGNERKIELGLLSAEERFFDEFLPFIVLGEIE
jgi:hypothetical protein